MDKTQNQLARELAVQLFGTAEPYCCLILQHDCKPVFRLHDGRGTTLAYAVWNGEQWQAFQDEMEV